MVPKTLNFIPEESADFVEELPPEKEPDLDRVLAELGTNENSTVKVERFRKGKAIEYIDVYQADTFTLKLLQDTYGGGDYRITGRRANGTYKFQRPVSLAEPIRPDTKEIQTHDIIGALNESFRQQNERLMQWFMMQSKAAPVVDQSESRLHILEEIKAIKQIFGPQQDTQQTAEKSLDLIKMGLEFGKDLNSSETNNWDLLLKGMEHFSAPLSDALQVQNDEKRAALASSQQQQPQPQPKPKLNLQQKAMLDMQKRVNFLLQQASSNADPAAVAEIVLSYVTDSQIKVFLEDNPIEKLSKINPKVLEFNDWFLELGNELKLLLEEMEANRNVPESSSVTKSDSAPT